MTVHELPSRSRGLTGDEATELAWEAFRQAALKAQQTLDLQDGIAAGKAWAAFLNLFTMDGRLA